MFRLQDLIYWEWHFARGFWFLGRSAFWRVWLYGGDWVCRFSFRTFYVWGGYNISRVVGFYR